MEDVYILRTIIPAIMNRVCINGRCLHFEDHNTCPNEQSVHKWKMFTFFNHSAHAEARLL